MTTYFASRDDYYVEERYCDNRMTCSTLLTNGCLKISIFNLLLLITFTSTYKGAHKERKFSFIEKISMPLKCEWKKGISFKYSMIL